MRSLNKASNLQENLFPPKKFIKRNRPSIHMIRILANVHYGLALRAGRTTSTNRGFWNAILACQERGWLDVDLHLTRLGTLALSFYANIGIEGVRHGPK